MLPRRGQDPSGGMQRQDVYSLAWKGTGLPVAKAAMFSACGCHRHLFAVRESTSVPS